MLSLHVFCTLSPTLTVVQIRNLKIGTEISWNSTTSREFLIPKLVLLSRAKTRIVRMAYSEKVAPKSLQTSPLQWGTCHDATLGTPALCPRSPDVLLDSVTPEPYEFFKNYRVKIRWRSRILECITSSNETIPMYYNLNWKSASDSLFSLSSQCEESRDANKSVNDFPQVGQRIVAQVGLSEETTYESEWILGLEPSLFGGGTRYRIDLLVHDVFGTRVTRVTFALAVVGWSRPLVIAAIVGVVLVAVLLVALIGGSWALTRHWRTRRLVKTDTETPTNYGNSHEMYSLDSPYVLYGDEEAEKFIEIKQLNPSEPVAPANPQSGKPNIDA